MSAGLTRRICASSPTVIDGGSTRIPVSCTCSGFGGRGSGFARSGRTGRTLLLCFVMLPSFRSLSLSRRDAPDRAHQPLHRLPGHAGPDGSQREGQPHARHYRSTLRVRHALQYAAHRLRPDLFAATLAWQSAACKAHTCAPPLCAYLCLTLYRYRISAFRSNHRWAAGSVTCDINAVAS